MLMNPALALAAEASRLHVRRAAFEDVPAVLRLVREAIERGCRQHYSGPERKAVYLSYAQSLFIDVVRPYDSVMAMAGGQTIGFAQLDPAAGRLRALFVSGDVQGHGLGRALLECMERLAISHGRRRLHGAMSLNAVAFYERAGFRRCAGNDRLSLLGAVVRVVTMEKLLGRNEPPPLLRP